MPKPNSPPQDSDFKIYVDGSCMSNAMEEVTIMKNERTISDETVVHNEVGDVKNDIGEDMSQLEDPQQPGEDSLLIEDSQIEGSSSSISQANPSDSILEDENKDGNFNEDSESQTNELEHESAEAKEKTRKRIEARELQVKMIEEEIKAAARKVVETIEKDNHARNGQGQNDSVLSTKTDESFDSESHNDSLLSMQTDDHTPTGSNLTQETDEDSMLHQDFESSDAQTERGGVSDDVEGGDDSLNHDADIDDDDDDDEDVFSHESRSARSSLYSADTPSRNMTTSNRTSWRNSREIDLSKEAAQLVELNSPVVGEEAATETISRIPSGSSSVPHDKLISNTCSPRKVSRHPFRTPSDVRALQMHSPAPSLFSTPRSAKRPQAYHPTVSRLGTPTSMSSKSRTPTRFKTKKEAPLVLLHVTLLPLQWPYTKAVISPELSADLYSIREAYYLLQEKLSETIISRGILLPHPQDSYEVLEERLLEALELPVRPRAKILKCGHYIGPSAHSSDEDSADDRDSGFGSGKGRPDRTWCDICRREVRYENADPDDDDKRFNIKIFASNGLMRAGAWAAAWKEMERVDVEIEPYVQTWMVEDMEDLIERLEEAERNVAVGKRGSHEDADESDSFVDYSNDELDVRESLGTEAQRLHEEAVAAKAAMEAEELISCDENEISADRLVQEQDAERNRLEIAAKERKEAMMKRVQDEETAAAKAVEQKLEQEPIGKEEDLEAKSIEEEAQRILDQELGSEKQQEIDEIEQREFEEYLKKQQQEQEEKEIEEEAQRIHAEELAAAMDLEEEAQRLHVEEIRERERRAVEEEARRLSEEGIAKRKVREEEEVKKEEEKRMGLEKEEKEKRDEQDRLKNIYEKAKKRPKSTSSTPKHTKDDSLAELLIKAAGVAMRDFGTAMRDGKNIAIAVLSVLVLVMALRPTTGKQVLPGSNAIVQNRVDGMRPRVGVREIEVESEKESAWEKMPEVVIQTSSETVVGKEVVGEIEQLAVVLEVVKGEEKGEEEEEEDEEVEVEEETVEGGEVDDVAAAEEDVEDIPLAASGSEAQSQDGSESVEPLVVEGAVDGVQAEEVQAEEVLELQPEMEVEVEVLQEENVLAASMESESETEVEVNGEVDGEVDVERVAEGEILEKGMDVGKDVGKYVGKDIPALLEMEREREREMVLKEEVEAEEADDDVESEVESESVSVRGVAVEAEL